MPMPAPWVSIVTPSFNQGRFLRRTIESVLAQSYPHIEYLVFDGGSTDESAAILHSYGERFFWVSRPDGGQADAINQGLRRARGSILAYLNSDDVLAPRAVETVVQYLEANTDWDLVYGRACYLDAEDRPAGWYDTRAFTLARLIEGCIICQPAAFWRRSVVDRIGPFDAGLRCAMDYDYWLRLALAGGKLVHVPEVLAGSRLHADAKTLAQRDRCLSEAIEVCSRHLGGDTPETHFHALWRHRASLASGLTSRLLALNPVLPDLIAHWHWLWRTELRRSPASLARKLIERSVGKLKREFGWIG
jgi:glycosyltransferase involved in cell wall biosynthesis